MKNMKSPNSGLTVHVHVTLICVQSMLASVDSCYAACRSWLSKAAKCDIKSSYVVTIKTFCKLRWVATYLRLRRYHRVPTFT